MRVKMPIQKILQSHSRFYIHSRSKTRVHRQCTTLNGIPSALIPHSFLDSKHSLCAYAAEAMGALLIDNNTFCYRKTWS